VEAGAEFAVTQPVFDPEELTRFLARISAFRIPVIAGIWPLTSLRNAEFLANEVPGARVPESVLERMRQAEARGPAAAHAEGARLAQEVLESVRGMVQGIQVSTPGGRIGTALEALGQLAV
jgi:homocysteine S-methyltransferase